MTSGKMLNMENLERRKYLVKHRRTNASPDTYKLADHHRRRHLHRHLKLAVWKWNWSVSKVCFAFINKIHKRSAKSAVFLTIDGHFEGTFTIPLEARVRTLNWPDGASLLESFV